MSIENRKLIKQLHNDFDTIQSKLVKRPVLGASKWRLINYRILDNNGLIEINMEDGHIENKALLQYLDEENTFKILKENNT